MLFIMDKINMKKVFNVFTAIALCLCGLDNAFADNAQSPSKANSEDLEELESYKANLEPLSAPHSYIAGVYYGIGIGGSRMSNTLNCIKQELDAESKQDLVDWKNRQERLKQNPQQVPTEAEKKADEALEAKLRKLKYIDGDSSSESSSANHMDIAAILGFGGLFYKNYYAGFEFLLNNRCSAGENKKSRIRHTSSFSFNANARLGYQITQHGMMPYIFLGFAHVLGSVTFDEGKTLNRVGSFYPVIGAGLEYKMQYCNVRFELSQSISSYDSDRSVGININSRYRYEAKPKKTSIRFIVTKNI